MKGKKERSYLIVYQQQTDGPILVATRTKREIKVMIEDCPYDAYAIFDGICLKTFSSKFDVGRLK